MFARKGKTFLLYMTIKILVVEDEQVIRDNLYEILSEGGFEVFLAENVSSALSLVFSDPPDLILCDIKMEHDDSGFRFLERLRLDKKTSRIPFIFLSAYKDHQRRGMNLGADDFIVKPFTKEELESAIASRLKRVGFLSQQENPAYAYIILHAPGLPEAGVRHNVEGYLMLGRNQRCNVRIADPHISSIHCVIQPKLDSENGACWITDGPITKTPTPSTYGIFINGHKIENVGILRGGERVQISPQCWFEFRSVEPSDTDDPTQSSES